MTIRLGYSDGNYVNIAEMNNLHIFVHQKIHVHLVAIDSVPEYFEQLLGRMDSLNDKTLAEVILPLVLLDAKQDCSAFSIGKGRIRTYP